MDPEKWYVLPGVFRHKWALIFGGEYEDDDLGECEDDNWVRHKTIEDLVLIRQLNPDD